MRFRLQHFSHFSEIFLGGNIAHPRAMCGLGRNILANQSCFNWNKLLICVDSRGNKRSNEFICGIQLDAFAVIIEKSSVYIRDRLTHTSHAWHGRELNFNYCFVVRIIKVFILKANNSMMRKKANQNGQAINKEMQII